MLDYEVHAAFSANNSYRLYKDLKDASTRRRLAQAIAVQKHLREALYYIDLEILDLMAEEDEALL